MNKSNSFQQPMPSISGLYDELERRIQAGEISAHERNSLRSEDVCMIDDLTFLLARVHDRDELVAAIRVTMQPFASRLLQEETNS